MKAQHDIVMATRIGDRKEVTQAQHKLVRSFAARALAVRRVTSNKGAKTPGLDGQVWLADGDRLAGVHRLKDLSGYKALPVKRVYTPKKDGTLRPLGIPTLFDRSVQALYGLALSPVVEEASDKRSYGFRPYRSTRDAATYLKLVLGAKYNPRR